MLIGIDNRGLWHNFILFAVIFGDKTDSISSILLGYEYAKDVENDNEEAKIDSFVH